MSIDLTQAKKDVTDNLHTETDSSATALEKTGMSKNITAAEWNTLVYMLAYLSADGAFLVRAVNAIISAIGNYDGEFTDVASVLESLESYASALKLEKVYNGEDYCTYALTVGALTENIVRGVSIDIPTDIVRRFGALETSIGTLQGDFSKLKELVDKVGIVQEATYDPASEELTLTFKKVDGTSTSVSIDISELVDETALKNYVNGIADTQWLKNANARYTVVQTAPEGHQNWTLAKSSAAFGQDTVVGMRAIYYSAIDPYTKTIYLSATQTEPNFGDMSSYTIPNDAPFASWQVGDWIGIMNTSHFVYRVQVAEPTSKGIVRYTGELGFDRIPLYGNSYDRDEDSYTVYNLTRPWQGEFSMTNYALAAGLGSKAVGSYSFSIGKNTTAYNYGVAEGHTTTAGYAGHAEGKQTKALGDEGSHAEGRSTEVRGNRGHAEGSFTQVFGWGGHAEGRSLYDDGYESYNKIAYSPTLKAVDVEAKWKSSKDTDKQLIAFGEAAHAEGGGTAALGDFSHTEGLRTLAKAKASHASGVGTETLTEGETAVGRYNARTSGNLFSVGNGTSDTARRTAFAIREDGSMTLDGVVVTPEQLSGYRLVAKSGRFYISEASFASNDFAYSGTYAGEPSASREGYVEFASSDTSMWSFATRDTAPILSPNTYIVLNPRWVTRHYSGNTWLDAVMQGDIVFLTSETLGPGFAQIDGTVYYIEEA